MKRILRIRREGFSMLTAIVVIVLMATVAVFILSLSGKSVKETTAQFQDAQAALWAKSYTEFAVMAVTANDRTATCLNTINGRIGGGAANGGYDVKVDITYIGNGNGKGDVSKCANVITNSVQEPKSPLSVILDVYVRYQEPDDPNQRTVTYHRRTLQKI